MLLGWKAQTVTPRRLQQEYEVLREISTSSSETLSPWVAAPRFRGNDAIKWETVTTADTTAAATSTPQSPQHGLGC